jgi:hypothetical protein
MKRKGTVSNRPVKGDGGQNRPQASLDSRPKPPVLDQVAQICKAVSIIAELVKSILF